MLGGCVLGRGGGEGGEVGRGWERRGMRLAALPVAALQRRLRLICQRVSILVLCVSTCSEEGASSCKLVPLHLVHRAPPPPLPLANSLNGVSWWCMLSSSLHRSARGSGLKRRGRRIIFRHVESSRGTLRMVLTLRLERAGARVWLSLVGVCEATRLLTRAGR